MHKSSVNYLCHTDFDSFSPTPLLLIANEKGHKKMDAIVACVNAEKAKRPDVDIHLKEIGNEDLVKQFPQMNFSKSHKGCIENTAGVLRADKCLATVQVRNYKHLMRESLI